jgi:hypothetical protein
MPFFRRVRGVRASIPSGSVIGRKSGGTGAAEVISPGDIVRAGSTAAPSAIPGPAGTGVGSNGQVWGTQGGTAQWTLLSALTALGTIATGVWQATKIALAYGGTNADLSGTGGAHKFLRQNSAGAAIDVVQPDFSDLASTLGAHLLAGTGISLSGTTDVTITNTGSGGTVTHTVGGLTLHAPVVGNGSADIKTLAAMTDGQLMIGSTGNDPSLATLTAGSNITITNAPGSITIAASGGGGSGTVTSVAATVPTGLAVSGSPITTSGTLGFTWSGLIPLAQGGTHVDLTGTGPGYLKQASAGASVTVAATIPYSDITGGPASSNYDVGDWTRAPIRQGSRMFLSQQLGGGMPAAGGICGGPLCSAPMMCDTLEWIVPVQVDNIATGAGRGLIWEGPVALGGMNGRWVPSSNLFALVNPHGLSYLALLGYGDKQTINATRANGSVAAPTVLSANDVIGRYTWVGYDGSASAFNNIMGSLVVTATENVTGSAAGSKIEFGVNKAGTTTSGAGNPPTALTVKGEGCIIAGTNTNDNASAGIMGEVVSSNILTGSAVALVSATAKDITTITLTAGDWEVSGVVAFKPAGTTTITQQIAALNTATNTLPTLDPATPLEQQSGSTVTGVGSVMGTGTARVSLSATTTYRLIAQSTFATSTMAAYGYIYARRMR